MIETKKSMRAAAGVATMLASVKPSNKKCKRQIKKASGVSNSPRVVLKSDRVICSLSTIDVLFLFMKCFWFESICWDLH